MPYEDLINNFKTPMYVFDINKLVTRINYLKSKFTNKSLVYAVKANTFVAKELDKYVDKFEICSNGEFDICNNLNINHNKMVISGVYKDYESIDKMMKYDIDRFTIESIEQFKLLESMCIKHKKNVHVLIRLTSNNQFGVTEEEAKYIIKNNKELIIDGIEYFSGTQKTSLKKINKEVDYLKEFIDSIEQEFNFEIKEIEYGPGLPIHYFVDQEFDEDTFFDEINTILEKLGNKKILLEIGRSMVATCGYYLTKVVDMKTNIYGSLCTINDIIVKNINSFELQIGDVFIFKNVGAYSSTEGISLFLSRDLPCIVLYKDNKFIKVRDNLKTSDINYPNY